MIALAEVAVMMTVIATHDPFSIKALNLIGLLYFLQLFLNINFGNDV